MAASRRRGHRRRGHARRRHARRPRDRAGRPADRAAAPGALGRRTPRRCRADAAPHLALLEGDFFCAPFGEDRRARRARARLAGQRRLARARRAPRRRRLGHRAASSSRETVRGRARHQGDHAPPRPSGRLPAPRPRRRRRRGPDRAPRDDPRARRRAAVLLAQGLRRHALDAAGDRSRPAAARSSPIRSASPSLAEVGLADGTTPRLRALSLRRGARGLPDPLRSAATPASAGRRRWPRADGFVFFAVKDAPMLSQTSLWMSNGGRYYAPWSSRHRAVLGIEESTHPLRRRPARLGRRRTTFARRATAPRSRSAARSSSATRSAPSRCPKAGARSPTSRSATAR